MPLFKSMYEVQTDSFGNIIVSKYIGWWRISFNENQTLITEKKGDVIEIVIELVDGKFNLKKHLEKKLSEFSNELLSLHWDEIVERQFRENEDEKKRRILQDPI